MLFLSIKFCFTRQQLFRNIENELICELPPFNVCVLSSFSTTSLKYTKLGNIGGKFVPFAAV